MTWKVASGWWYPLPSGLLPLQPGSGLGTGEGFGDLGILGVSKCAELSRARELPALGWGAGAWVIVKWPGVARSLGISADGLSFPPPELHPILWPLGLRLRLRPSSGFGLCYPALAPGAPRRRLLSLLHTGTSSWAPAAAAAGIPARPAGAWGLPPAWAGPHGAPGATRRPRDHPARPVLRPPG